MRKKEKDTQSMRTFVCYYTPSRWKENCHTVVFVPYWNEEEFNKFKEGIFPKDMLWCFKEAIEEYFKN